MIATQTLKRFTTAGALAALAFAVTPGVSFARHGQQQLVSAVHGLHEATEHFNQVARDRTGNSRIAGLAQRAGEEAHHLQEVVRGGATNVHVARDFDNFRRLFTEIDRTLGQMHAPSRGHVMRDWRLVEEEGMKVARMLGTSLWVRSYGGHGRGVVTRHGGFGQRPAVAQPTYRGQSPAYRGQSRGHRGFGMPGTATRGNNVIRFGPMAFRF